ncbi:hypothetical protein ACIBKY_53465 [Nonomuraea sp. NPDC050394]|uniref:hypothetical protein n=1 Tax=Nonomuraea sp. NPDC050394 TaxID=3364363 RepID=UPI0037B4EE2A
MVAVDLHQGQLVSAAEWNHGDPVRIGYARRSDAGHVAVLYRDAACRERAQRTVVEVGMELTLISGGCVGGGR